MANAALKHDRRLFCWGSDVIRDRAAPFEACHAKMSIKVQHHLLQCVIHTWYSYPAATAAAVAL